MSDKIVIEYRYTGPGFKRTDGSEYEPNRNWAKWKSYTKEKSALMALEVLPTHFQNYEFRIRPNDPNP